MGCEETSGDDYDYIDVAEGRIGLVVGDVAGHGVSAALFMATARALLRAFLVANTDPAVTLGNLNDFLCEDMETGRFMTLFFGELDVKSRSLRYVRAGHNAPLLDRRETDSFEELEAPGVALGMVRAGFSTPSAGIVAASSPRNDQRVSAAAAVTAENPDSPVRLNGMKCPASIQKIPTRAMERSGISLRTVVVAGPV